MYEWNEAVQKMIDWIEAHLTEDLTLLEMSRQIGYSPYYCSSRFHTLTGMTLKRYIAKRRLCRAALEIRDTQKRILDIALRYGFSSQQAFSRAFKAEYGFSPALYRQAPQPIPLSMKKEILFPEYYTQKGEHKMSKIIAAEPCVRVEYIPAHQYIGIWDAEVQGYFQFWERHNCDEVCGMIESMSHIMHPIVTCHTAGWFEENGKRGYFYGLGTDEAYKGEIPKGFHIRKIPASYYLVFSHPPFDYLQDCEAVCGKVEQLAWSFNPQEKGFRWNEACNHAYQKMCPETIGYEIFRPIVC